MVRAGFRTEPIDKPALRRYFEANGERWREPVLLDLTHVYLSRDKRGERADPDAEALRARLERESTPPETAIALGDPFLGGHQLRGATPTRIASRLGPGFADALRDAEAGESIGPSSRPSDPISSGSSGASRAGFLS